MSGSESWMMRAGKLGNEDEENSNLWYGGSDYII
jgi:hypothetical protein